MFIYQKNNDLDTLEQSFQDGCDTIVGGCTTYGSTPSSNSPTDIVNAIKNIYDNRYTAGRTQGQNDVKNNPSAYGITPAPKSQSGSETRNFKHGESYDWVVTFPTAFASTPKVNVGVQGLSFGYEVEANNLRITKAGFTYWVWNQAGQPQNIKLTWNAIL